MKTHLVTDNHYSSNEDMYIAFSGTHEECVNYKQEQSEISFADSFMLNVVPMTEKELYEYNPEQQQIIGIDKTKFINEKINNNNYIQEKVDTNIYFGKSGTPRKEIIVDDISASIDDYNMNIFKRD